MRVDILANDRASFIKPMAEGLARMLESLNVEAHLHRDGLEHLMRRQSIDVSSLRSFAGSTARLATNRREFSSFIERLRGTDLIIVVAHTPASFSVSMLPNVELVRKNFPGVPIVNYDLVYLPSLDSWRRAILKDEKTGLSQDALDIIKRGKFGMERFDWYLLTSIGGYTPLDKVEHPYSIIGINIDDGRIYPDQQGEFSVLVDFPQNRGHYPEYRRVQLEALKIAGVKYEMLEGSYSRDELLAVFRRSAVLLLGHAESFGLPICEAQGCGCMIFTPDPHWATAHWLSEEYQTDREPGLSPNFVVYENEPEKLAARLRAAADSFNPQKVRDTFIEMQPRLFRGDIEALKSFLDRVKSGDIHPALHSAHSRIGKLPTSGASRRTAATGTSAST
jgi:hypothetical protein